MRTETEEWKLEAQESFPEQYDLSRDLLIVREDDDLQARLRQFNEGVGFGYWARTSLRYHTLELLVSMLAPNSTTVWTGWRVTSTVRTGWRFPVYRLEIFARDGAVSA